jgi:hypothetical protein
MFDRLVRIAALSIPLLILQPVIASEVSAKETPAKEMPAKTPSASETPAASPAAPAAKQPSAGQTAARDRQKKCGAEWRTLTDVQKTAQGPKWPQYWSKCNKRLKGGDKA